MKRWKRIRRRLRRLVDGGKVAVACRIFNHHSPITVIDGVKIKSMTLFPWFEPGVFGHIHMDVTASHKECKRCRRSL